MQRACCAIVAVGCMRWWRAACVPRGSHLRSRGTAPGSDVSTLLGLIAIICGADGATHPCIMPCGMCVANRRARAASAWVPYRVELSSD